MKNLTISLFCLLLTITLALFCQKNYAADTVPDGTKEKTDYASVEERRLHATVQAERMEMKKERLSIEIKKNELKTLEAEVDKKLKQVEEKLKAILQERKNIEALLVEKDEKEAKKTIELSKIYAKMTPERAAMAITNLDAKLASELLANMKVKSAAKIMDKLDKLKMSQLSTTFSTLQPK